MGHILRKLSSPQISTNKPQKDERNTYNIWHTGETVNVIMMIHNNTRLIVNSTDGDTPFPEITTGVLQGETSAPFLSYKLPRLYSKNIFGQ